MQDKFFLDTNILVYSFDQSTSEKVRRSRELIRSALGGRGTISWQVVQEFSNVALRKFEVPMSPQALHGYMDAVLFPLCGIYPSRELYFRGLGIHSETGLAWYDSLIVAAAEILGCSILYSEDMQHGRRIRGLEIVDPFR